MRPRAACLRLIIQEAVPKSRSAQIETDGERGLAAPDDGHVEIRRHGGVVHVMVRSGVASWDPLYDSNPGMQ